MIRLGVDAANILHDRRGMGRLTRPVIHAAIEDPRFRVTLLARRRDARALREEFGDHVIVLEPRTAAHPKGLDVVWFPFNGMRYRSAAPSLVTMCDAFAFTAPVGGLVARWREQSPIRRAAREATRICTISDWSAQQLSKVLRIAPERMTVIQPMPDPFFFPAGGDTLPPNLQGKRFVLFVAGPEPRKNAAMLFEACGKALHAPDETLAVVGTLSDRDEERLRAYGTPHVRLRADDALLRALYRNATVTAVPSLGEGFGLVAVEAMACGAALIAANAAALPEATGGDAILVNPRNPDAWAQALRTLLDDSGLRSALSARAAARYAFADRTKPVRTMLGLLAQVSGHQSPQPLNETLGSESLRVRA